MIMGLFCVQVRNHKESVKEITHQENKNNISNMWKTPLSSTGSLRTHKNDQLVKH